MTQEQIITFFFFFKALGFLKGNVTNEMEFSLIKASVYKENYHSLQLQILGLKSYENKRTRCFFAKNHNEACSKSFII